MPSMRQSSSPRRPRRRTASETGTQNHEGIVGAGAAVRWLGSLSPTFPGLRAQLTSTYAALHEREAVLFERLWNGIGAIPGVTRYGPLPGTARTATLAFTLADHPARDVAIQLAAEGCFVSHGDYYATTIARRLGVAEHGMVRIGAACYTTMEDRSRHRRRARLARA